MGSALNTAMLTTTQVDGVVGAVNKMGFFAEVGPLNVFVSSHVSILALGRLVPSHPLAHSSRHQIRPYHKSPSVLG